MSTVIVDNLSSDEMVGSDNIPLTELGYRVIKEYTSIYTSGQWNPNNSYAWMPGMYVDYTPLSSSSRIRVYCSVPGAGVNSAHAISHWIFYRNGTELGRHSVSGQHFEDNNTYTWDMASWGTTSGRIGYQMRSYANDNHEVRLYRTRYWNGGGSNQNCRGQFVLYEYLTQGL